MQIWLYNVKLWFIEDFDYLDDYYDFGYIM